MIRLRGCILLALLLLTSGVWAQEGTPTPPYIYYTVVQGDTLNSIALHYGTTVRALLDANNIVNPDVIYWGLRIRIPLPMPMPPASAPSATPPPAPTAAPPAAPTPAQPATPHPSIDFDLGGEIFSAAHFDVLKSASMTWAKMSLRWNPGDALDSPRKAIKQAHTNGLKLLLQISADPQAYLADSAHYGRIFAEYLGQVSALAPEAIQVWSDMDAAPTISPSAYAQFLSVAFQAIKRANPQVLVVSGALAQITPAACSSENCDDLSYLRGMAQAGVGQYADCIGMRYTLGAVSPDTTSGDPRGDQLLYYYPSLISLYAAVFPEKPLCLTDIGYLVAASTRYDWAKNTTLQEQAQWLATAALLARESGRIRLFVVYNVDATTNTPDNPQAGYAILVPHNGCLPCLALSAALRLH